MTALSIIATIVGTIMSLSGVPQIIKIYKGKSVKDISPITYVILALGSIVWISYGKELKNFTIVFTNTLGMIVWATILFQYFLYRNKNK